MCGILGIIGQHSESVRANAASLIAHRGPDAQASYTFNGIFLAHSRLAIQDLTAAGAQPMTTEDGRFTIVFNGEIYNHKDLRLKFNPFEFFTGHSDTETILHAWAKHGVEILPHLNGIFAFAVFDKLKNTLTIARDRFGTKPLYYYRTKDTFAFASELKALKDIPGLDKTINHAAIADYLTLLYATGDKTPFLHIKKLLPGHYSEIDLNTLQDCVIRKYPVPQVLKTQLLTEKDYLHELEIHLQNAVERQLLSDVPVGYFLSGGLDSSALVALARKKLGDVHMDAFTLDAGGLSEKDGFAEDVSYAEHVAKILLVNLHVIKTSPKLVENFEQMVWQLDEPMADAAALNVEIICKEARALNYKVLLSGTGADELFGGYRRHQALKIEPVLGWIPGFIRQGLGILAKPLPVANPTFRRGKKLLNAFSLQKEERLISYHDWLSYSQVLHLFDTDISEKLRADYHPHLFFRNSAASKTNNTKLSDLEQMLAWERQTYLPDDCLLYTDKMSMACGVEVRVPFLDNELVDFSTQIPAHLKIKGNTTKYLLKKLMEKYLPDEVIYRPKTGFGAPVRKWVNGDLDARIQEYLSPESVTKRGIFNPRRVQDLIRKNKSGQIDASHSIWALLAIESWMRQFVD